MRQDVSWHGIREEFLARVNRIVWASVATVDRRGRPRGRVLHPVWEDQTGWIGTGRHSLKEKHLARNPYVSLTYWGHDEGYGDAVYIEAKAEWADYPTDRLHAWELFKSKPEPLGYDPGLIWPTGHDGPDFGVLKLTPSRIELSGPNDYMKGAFYVWRADSR